MLNLFVPGREAIVATAVRGLTFGPGGELQKDFVAHHGKQAGTFLAGSSDKGCLCGFDDWPALYEIARGLLERCGVGTLSVLRFWSGDRYSLAFRTIDSDDEALCTPGELGEVLVVKPMPPERRRHRRVVRALVSLVGARATLHLKSGEERRGVVASFDAESEVGIIDDACFVAAEVLSVDTAAQGR
jgi:hypothetical protein